MALGFNYLPGEGVEIRVATDSKMARLVDGILTLRRQSSLLPACPKVAGHPSKSIKSSAKRMMDSRLGESYLRAAFRQAKE